MKSALLMAGLALGGSGWDETQSLDRAADQVALTCLSEGPVLFAAGLAVGRESPDENAALRTSRIADTCRSARLALQPLGHVCLTMVSNGERLADDLSQVYSGRVSAPDFLAASNAESLESEDDRQLEANAQCEARMAELTKATTTGENQ